MASACLPMVFQAVEIDGEHYWDGGYAVNPALTPLIEGCDCADLMLVQINPLRRDDVPKTSAEIADRIAELTFNASLLTQMRSVDLINQLIAAGALKASGMKSVRLHRIDGGAATAMYPASSRAQADAGLIQALFEAGQHAAGEWLHRHFEAIGQHGTVDIRRDYLDDTRDAISAHHVPPQKFGFRPWLARLFLRRSRRQA
jgi:NTE family protein